MRAPRMTGVVERRLLVNYRVDPAVSARLLPAPLRPQVVNGWAVAGVCLLRLGSLRPRHVPAVLGRRSENAAHRIAVEWDDPAAPGGVSSGVYIPRRDSGSLLNVVVGGRLFPGYHHRARFEVRETGDDLRVAFTSEDRTAGVRVQARPSPHWAGSAIFADLAAASDFFRRGAAGYSATASGDHLDGLEMRTDAWHIEPAEVLAAESSFFSDESRFPAGSATLDCALVMRDVPVLWHPLPPLPIRQAVSV